MKSMKGFHRKIYESEIQLAFEWATPFENPNEYPEDHYSIASIVCLFQAAYNRPNDISKRLWRLAGPYDEDKTRRLMDHYEFPQPVMYRILENWTSAKNVPPLFNVSMISEKYELLHLATAKKNSNLVNWLIENGADVNARDSCNRTALHLAAIHNCYEITHILGSQGASFFALDNINETPFEKALVKANFLLADLLEPTFFCNRKGLCGQTLFYKMILLGLERQCNYLLRYADLTVLSDIRQSVLHAAAYSGNPNITEMLLRHYNNREILNSVDIYDQSPLFIAVYRNRTDVADVLLRNGAEITPRVNEQLIKENSLDMIALFQHHQSFRTNQELNPLENLQAVPQENHPLDHPVDLDANESVND